MDEVLRSRVSDLLRSEVSDTQSINRGYSGAGRWVVALADGSSWFVKVGWTNPTRDMVRAEARFYQSFQGTSLPDWSSSRTIRNALC